VINGSTLWLINGPRSLLSQCWRRAGVGPSCSADIQRLSCQKFIEALEHPFHAPKCCRKKLIPGYIMPVRPRHIAPPLEQGFGGRKCHSKAKNCIIFKFFHPEYKHSPWSDPRTPSRTSPISEASALALVARCFNPWALRLPQQFDKYSNVKEQSVVPRVFLGLLCV